jgi:hypothetical protein
LLKKQKGDVEMIPLEAQQALEDHAPCSYYSTEESGLLNAETFYDVEVIRVEDDSTYPRIVVRSIGIDRADLEIDIAREEDFHLLQLTSYMEEEFIEVEYDTAYEGGDYSDVGDFAYIPARLVDEIGMEKAFQRTTTHDPKHIIHWTENATIDRYELWQRVSTDM